MFGIAIGMNEQGCWNIANYDWYSRDVSYPLYCFRSRCIYFTQCLNKHSYPIREGLKHDFHARSMNMEQDIVVSKHLAVSNSLLHQDTQKSASNLSNSKIDQNDPQAKTDQGTEVNDDGEVIDDSTTEAN